MGADDVIHDQAGRSCRKRTGTWKPSQVREVRSAAPSGTELSYAACWPCSKFIHHNSCWIFYSLKHSCVLHRMLYMTRMCRKNRNLDSWKSHQMREVRSAAPNSTELKYVASAQ